MKQEYVPKKDYRPVIRDIEVVLREFASKKPTYDIRVKGGEGEVLFELRVSMGGRRNGLYNVRVGVGYRENRFDEKSWETSPHSVENFSFPEQKVGITGVDYTFPQEDFNKCWMVASPNHTGNLRHSVIYGSSAEKAFQERAAKMLIDQGALLEPMRGLGSKGGNDYSVKFREPINHLSALQFMLEELERMSQ